MAILPGRRKFVEDIARKRDASEQLDLEKINYELAALRLPIRQRAILEFLSNLYDLDFDNLILHFLDVDTFNEELNAVLNIDKLATFLCCAFLYKKNDNKNRFTDVGVTEDGIDADGLITSLDVPFTLNDDDEHAVFVDVFLIQIVVEIISEFTDNNKYKNVYLLMTAIWQQLKSRCDLQ